MSFVSTWFSFLFPTLSLLKNLGDSFSRGIRSLGRWADIGAIPIVGGAYAFCHKFYYSAHVNDAINYLKEEAWPSFFDSLPDLQDAISQLGNVFSFLAYILSLDTLLNLFFLVVLPIWLAIKVWTLFKGWIFRIAPGFSP